MLYSFREVKSLITVTLLSMCQTLEIPNDLNQKISEIEIAVTKAVHNFAQLKQRNTEQISYKPNVSIADHLKTVYIGTLFPHNQLSLYDHLSILGVFVDIETPNVFKLDKEKVTGRMKTKCMYIRGVTIDTLCLLYTNLVTQRTSQLHPPVANVLNVGTAEPLNDATVYCTCEPSFDSWNPIETNGKESDFKLNLHGDCPISKIILKQITYMAETFNNNDISKLRWANKIFCSMMVNRDSHWILLTFSLRQGKNAFTCHSKTFNQYNGHTVPMEDLRRLFYHFAYAISVTENMETYKKYKVKDFCKIFPRRNIVFSKNCFANLDGGLAYQNIAKTQIDSVSCGAVALINLIAELPVRNAARLETTQCLDEVLQQKGYRAILFLDSLLISRLRISIVAYTHYTQEYKKKAQKRKLLAKYSRVNFKAQKLAAQGIPIKKQNGTIVNMPKVIETETISTEQELVVPQTFNPSDICSDDQFRGPTPEVPGLMSDL